MIKMNSPFSRTDLGRHAIFSTFFSAYLLCNSDPSASMDKSSKIKEKRSKSEQLSMASQMQNFSDTLFLHICFFLLIKFFHAVIAKPLPYEKCPNRQHNYLLQKIILAIFHFALLGAYRCSQVVGVKL
jgi:hypothetical protein